MWYAQPHDQPNSETTPRERRRHRYSNIDDHAAAHKTKLELVKCGCTRGAQKLKMCKKSHAMHSSM